MCKNFLKILILRLSFKTLEILRNKLSNISEGSFTVKLFYAIHSIVIPNTPKLEITQMLLIIRTGAHPKPSGQFSNLFKLQFSQLQSTLHILSAQLILGSNNIFNKISE